MEAATTALARADELATFTEEPGGITRPLASPSLDAAMERAREWMEAAGMTTRRDALGNLVGRREGRGPGTLVLGSHLDSVADAGRYDGILGVLVGLAVAEAVGELPLALEVVAFADEEGLRFQSTFLGSRAFVGRLAPEELDAARCRGRDPRRGDRRHRARPRARAGGHPGVLRGPHRAGPGAGGGGPPARRRDRDRRPEPLQPGLRRPRRPRRDDPDGPAPRRAGRRRGVRAGRRARGHRRARAGGHRRRDRHPARRLQRHPRPGRGDARHPPPGRRHPRAGDRRPARRGRRDLRPPRHQRELGPDRRARRHPLHACAGRPAGRGGGGDRRPRARAAQRRRPRRGHAGRRDRHRDALRALRRRASATTPTRRWRRRTWRWPSTPPRGSCAGWRRISPPRRRPRRRRGERVRPHRARRHRRHRRAACARPTSAWPTA